jgi:uncharacterized protein (TIGR03067 family)
MKLVATLAVVVCLAADAPKEDSKKDMEKLQGEWILASLERDGEQLPEEQAKSRKRSIKGDKFTITRDGETLAQGTFTLDASKKPKTLDAKLEGNDEAVQAIYELDGDTFKMCYAQPGQPRPKEFAGKADSGHTLAVWKRVKK